MSAHYVIYPWLATGEHIGSPIQLIRCLFVIGFYRNIIDPLFFYGNNVLLGFMGIFIFTGIFIVTDIM